MTDPNRPDEYRIEELRDAFAKDPRIGELGIDVKLAAGDVFVRGSVTTAERREAIGEVARDLMPDRAVHNEVTVEELSDPHPPENLS